MKIRLVFLTLAYLLFKLANGQGNTCSFANITEGPEDKEFNSQVKEVLGSDDEFFYVVKRVGRSLHLAKVNAALEQVLDKKIELADFNELNRKPDFFVMLNKRVYLFSTCDDRKADNLILTCDEINTTTLDFKGTSKTVVRTVYQKAKNKGYFSYVKSADESKLLVFALYPDDKNPGVEYEFKVLDQDINALWEKRSRLDLKGQYVVIKQFLVQNNGNVMLSACEFPDRRSISNTRTKNYQYHLFTIGREGAENEVKLSLDDKYITEMKIGENPKSELCAVGFYSSKPEVSGNFGKREKAAGVFYIKLNEKGEQVNSSMQKFSFDFATVGLSENRKEKIKGKEEDEDDDNDAEVAEFDIRDVIYKEDGSMYLIAEQYFMTMGERIGAQTPGVGVGIGPGSSRVNSAGSNIVYNYYYDDIAVVKLDGSGNILWNTRIRKKQRDHQERSGSGNPFLNDLMISKAANANLKPDLNEAVNELGGLYCSFGYTFHNNKLFLIFNDNPKNSMPGANPDQRPLRMGRGSNIALTAVEIDQDGNKKREILSLQGKHGDALMIPKFSQTISPGNLFTVGDKRKLFQFFTIKF